ncbi:MAG TPA: hypothetical protein VLF18_20570 [Tahibacter sp.]|uniref:hypothetical protein n=1 Tax=Tahibacter sp. TaxID=2056211 RepID=UPI002BB5A130|nr:hypothetical protein [Tahibacter sp.]HSX62584.1 hypothetical protein [Tahibacter sp.]
MKPPSVFALALYCASSCAVADGTAAPALPVANIAGVGGQALLVQGAHVAPATNGAALYPGDRLMTLEDAQVLVAFADGCHRRLDPDSLLTIGEQPDCGGGAGVVSFRQAIGEAGGTKKDDDDTAAVVVDAGNADTTVTSLTPGQRWAVAAALLIPALYYWDRNRDDDDDRPPVSR